MNTDTLQKIRTAAHIAATRTALARVAMGTQQPATIRAAQAATRSVYRTVSKVAK